MDALGDVDDLSAHIVLGSPLPTFLAVGRAKNNRLEDLLSQDIFYIACLNNLAKLFPLVGISQLGQPRHAALNAVSLFEIQAGDIEMSDVSFRVDENREDGIPALQWRLHTPDYDGGGEKREGTEKAPSAGSANCPEAEWGKPWKDKQAHSELHTYMPDMEAGQKPFNMTGPSALPSAGPFAGPE
ncbi:hypothetical protein FNAPI_3103 [Fusarium napiforme]|uniref:Uncharacterized protein n=1 Tax=Fusarium napiforme TaxID=42672 RepID=A0A8H5JVJ7_9HYPO|nr:hypothetical protein FNAPI_3103 [Fusarium napiforme]